MSEVGIETWQASGASSADARAALWLAQRENADWNEAGQAELDAWLAESALHTIAYLRLRDAWQRADRLAALRGTRDISATHHADARTGPILLRLASLCFVLVMLAAGTYIYLSRPREATYATPVGGREVIALFDGSDVELNTDTVIRVGGDAGHRTVTLDKGEAYFQIRHDAQHPFVVNAFGHRVTDLGTRFVVRGNADRFEVALVEGRARIDSANDAHPVTLAPGDVAVATPTSITVTKKRDTVLADQLAWRQGLLIFNDTTLAEVAAQFNRYNSRKLIIADAATARLSIMGKFPVNDVELFGRVAKAVLGVRVETHENEVVISR